MTKYCIIALLTCLTVNMPPNCPDKAQESFAKEIFACVRPLASETSVLERMGRRVELSLDKLSQNADVSCELVVTASGTCLKVRKGELNADWNTSMVIEKFEAGKVVLTDCLSWETKSRFTGLPESLVMYCRGERVNTYQL